MSNKAKEVLLPTDMTVFRTVFLYVGQGDCALMIVPANGKRQFILMDTNVDKEAGGIDVARLLEDLLDDELDVFINTHPHSDHLNGIETIHDTVGVREIWDSGHVPGKNHKDAYDQLLRVMKKVGKANTYELRGTRQENTLDHEDAACLHPIGDVTYNVLAPAQYIKDEIEDETPETRYRRIHEQCGLVRFRYGRTPAGILHAGDSDRTAWEENKITEYHSGRLQAAVLSASHHGSRSFFKKDESDEASFNAHLEQIDPTYVVISSPKQSESKHEHPHDDAIEIYEEHVGADGILHLGKNRECVIVDIDAAGGITVTLDKTLVEEYGFTNDKKDDPSRYAGITVTKLDDKPMG